MTHEPSARAWFKSSHSNNQGGNCVEGSRLGGSAMAVRDSKDTTRGTLTLAPPAWNALTATLKAL